MPKNKIRSFLKHGTLTQMSVFEAVARLGSFTKAAEELYMAQPTVSVQMKKLSETVGLPLVEQIGKRVHLTEAGRAVQATTNKLFATLIELESQLANIRGMTTGRLQIAVSTTGKYFAPRLLGEFVKQHPYLHGGQLESDSSHRACKCVPAQPNQRVNSIVLHVVACDRRAACCSYSRMLPKGPRPLPQGGAEPAQNAGLIGIKLFKCRFNSPFTVHSYFPTEMLSYGSVQLPQNAREFVI
jgi:DNA-binding transcriptional LysR family regulator